MVWGESAWRRRLIRVFSFCHLQQKFPMDDQVRLDQQTEEIPSCIEKYMPACPCVQRMHSVLQRHQVKDFQSLLICDLQNSSSKGENPHKDTASLLIIVLFFSLSFH